MGAAGATLGATTETVAEPDLLGSAALVATTWKVPAVPGAVYLPVASTVPPLLPSCTDQVTETEAAALPAAAAVNDSLPLTGTDALCGLTSMAMLPPPAVCALQAVQSRTAKTATPRARIDFLSSGRCRRLVVRDAARDAGWRIGEENDSRRAGGSPPSRSVFSLVEHLPAPSRTGRSRGDVAQSTRTQQRMRCAPTA